MTRVTIVGRPNVGKSTLFNRLVGRRIAITDGRPGVTRDAVSVETELAGRRVLLIDTGGIGEGEETFRREVSGRSVAEIDRSDVVVVVLDGTALTPEDDDVVAAARRSGLPVVVAVNKVDSGARAGELSDFWALGFRRTVPVSAEHNLGVDELVELIDEAIEERGSTGEMHRDDRDEVVLAIVGRPNTGKSTLLNHFAGEERALVSPVAGTTRDTLDTRFVYRDTTFRVLDTAGIRKKARVSEPVEYYAVQRALTAIDRCELALLMIDATEGLGEQDKKIAARISERGRGVIVAMNKWDLLPPAGNQVEAVQDRVRFLFPVFQHVPIMPLSAATGTGVEEIVKRLLHIRGELHRRVDTGPLNQALRRWVAETPPPHRNRRPFKLRYMTQVETNPVRFLLFVNRTRAFPEAYLSYVRNRIRAEFGFEHVPIFVQLRS